MVVEEEGWGMSKVVVEKLGGYHGERNFVENHRWFSLWHCKRSVQT